MVLKTTPAQAKRIRRLVRKACCNYYHGDCLLLDDGESHPCVQLISIHAIYCNYFLNAVLPAEKKLCSEIYKIKKGNHYEKLSKQPHHRH
ncbi:MAG: cysteine-rich VLP domain-containing protein [Oscillospiraceae bacterium]|nr:cysteine-rich VLP domain-containing protein [Oscillospiraceae bacterium]